MQVHLCVCACVYVCTHMYAHASIGAQDGQRGHQILAAEITGSYQPPDVSSGSRTQVLWKNRKLS